MVSRDNIGVFTSFRIFTFLKLFLTIIDVRCVYTFVVSIAIFINDNALFLDHHVLNRGIYSPFLIVPEKTLK